MPWRTMTIGELCEVVNGGTPKTGVEEYWGGEHPWITPAEMGKRESPYVSATERRITNAGLRDSSAKLLPSNSVILSSRAPIGHLVINVEPMAFNQGCKGLVPGPLIDHKYLYYYLSSIVDVLNALGTGATFKELSSGKLKDVTVPVPPLAEQKRIVAILDEAFEGIRIATANAEKNLANTRELFDVELNRAWMAADDAEFIELSEVCERVTVGHVGPMATRYVEDGIPFLRSQNVRQFKVDLTDVKFIDQEFESELRKSKLKTGDVVVVRTGYPGTAAVVPPELDGANCSDLVIITCGKRLNPAYLALLLNSPRGKALVGLNLVGAAQKHFNVGAARALLLPVPTWDRQADIADEMAELLANTRDLERRYRERSSALIGLKQSILSRAFSGQLTAARERAA